MRPPLPGIRMTHWFHPPAEDPQDPIWIDVGMVLGAAIACRFSGIIGGVKHWCLPQDAHAVGDLALYHDLITAGQKMYPRLKRACEFNIIRHGNGPYTYSLEGNPRGFDIIIVSIHCTARSGWQSEPTPAEFLDAYRGVISQIQELQKKGYEVSFGHIMQYAQGDRWTETFMEVLQLAADHGIIAEINFPDLREVRHWTRDSITIGLEGRHGFTIFQPWAEKLCYMSTMKLAFCLDAHKREHLACLTYENWRLMCDLLEEFNMLRHFVG